MLECSCVQPSLSWEGTETRLDKVVEIEPSNISNSLEHANPEVWNSHIEVTG